MAGVINEKVETSEELMKNEENIEEKVEDTSGVSGDDIMDENSDYEEAENFVADLNLEFTFRSVRFAAKHARISMNQMRSCLFKIDKDDVGYDVYRACQLILMAGWVGSGQYKENEIATMEKVSDEILERWRQEFGFIGVLHILLIDSMEDAGFFMSAKSRSVKVLDYMNSKKKLEDVITSHLTEDLGTRQRQIQALKSEA